MTTPLHADTIWPYLRRKDQISPHAEFKCSGCKKYTVDLVMWHVVGLSMYHFTTCFTGQITWQATFMFKLCTGA